MLKKIRVSSLDTFTNCARLAACGVSVVDPSTGVEVPLPELAGITINTKKRGRKAHVGIAMHAAGESIAKDKLEGRPINKRAARQAVSDKLKENWDETEETGKTNRIETIEDAEKIIDNLFEALVAHVSSLNIVAAEISLEMQYNDNTVLTGHPDVVTDNGGRLAVRDYKSNGSTASKPHPAQIGGYGILLDNEGYPIDLGFIDEFQRLKTKEAARITTKYDMVEAKKFADATIERFSNNIDRFIATGDPNSFNANPASNLCSPKYCPAWGTDFCTVGKQQGERVEHLA